MIVWPCRLDVSTYAARGRDVAPPRPACPRCGGPTGPWSGYVRHLRDAELHRIFVPRVRCRRCGATAALLPWFVTPYRWDTVDVIGQALELSVGGQGVRRIAATLDRPESLQSPASGGSAGLPLHATSGNLAALEQTMARLDAEEGAAKASTQVVEPAEALAWLRDLPALWAAADDSGRRLLMPMDASTFGGQEAPTAG